MKPKFSVVIPTWNGEKLLRKNLASIVDSLPSSSEVIIIENGSTDRSVSFLKKFEKELKAKKKKTIFRVIYNKENLGFIGGCNQGAELAQGKYLVLINNDVLPEKGFLKPVEKHFKDDQVFGVSFRETNHRWGSWAKIFWHGGFFNYSPGEKISKSHFSGWASGGSAAFRLSAWKELKGFDPLFAPFYWEDLDLSYRAWKSGWKIIWEPKAKVKHHHESTISKLKKSYVDLIKERNQLLFIWKNITDWRFRLGHFFGLNYRVMLGPNYLKVIFNAWRQLRRVGLRRGDVKFKRTDREILNIFKEK